MKNTDQVINDYIIEIDPQEDTNKAYLILGVGNQSFVLDSASKKEVEEAKRYIENRMKSTLTYVSLRNQRILPILHWDEHRRIYNYKIYGISVDPKALPALIEEMCKKGYETKTNKTFLIYINDRNQIFNIEIIGK